MVLNNTAGFEKCWIKFTKQLKGKLINQKEKQNFTYSALKLILADAVTVWESKYDECGRWLIDYTKENPEKGELIKQVLLEDIKFTEIKEKKDSSRGVAIAVSAASAAIGFGISTVLNATNIVTAAATMLPAIAAYPAVTATGSAVKAKKEELNIDAYMNQLEKFRLSIVNVIEN